MIAALTTGLVVLLLLSVVGSAYFSFASRRAAVPRDRERRRAAMNIWLGAMLLLLSFVSMLHFTGSSVGVVVESIFLLIGLFNIYAGIRGYAHYSRELP